MQHTTRSPKDFEWTKMTEDDIKALVAPILAHKKKIYEQIKKIPAETRTFENTVFGIESSDYEIQHKILEVDVLMSTSTDPNIRKVATETFQTIAKEMVDIEYDKEVYRALKEYAAKQEKLEGPKEKLFKDMLRNYRRMGFDLPEETQAALKENLKELSELGTNFRRNISEYKDTIEVRRMELEGLSEKYIEGLRVTDRDTYLVGLEYPEYIPFMENAKHELKRKELAEKNLRKGGEANMQILKRLLELRDQNAKLLGYANHGAYVTETRMVKNPETVKSFLFGLAKDLLPLARKELEELQEYKRKDTGNTTATLEHYDISYYRNQSKKQKFNIDEEKVREYFPFEKVVRGVLDIYSELFSVTFEKKEGYPLWHEDVTLYAVKNMSGEILSYFLLDLFPREGKYNHAAAFLVAGGYLMPDGKYHSPICAMVANFNKPSANTPSLLSYQEVETFFHEFGHVMHATLTSAEYLSQSGSNAVWDFVEAPSQMLENWIWDKGILNKLSGHFLRPEETLPDDMMENLLRAKNHMIAYDSIRQLIFGIFDVTIHTSNPTSDIKKTFDEIYESHTGIKMPEGALFPAGFGHLVGYDAGYYGYLWSKVYACDMFTRFAKEGLLNQKTGQEYKEWILEKGSSMEEIDLVRGFLGREPNNEAFLKEIGL